MKPLALLLAVLSIFGCTTSQNVERSHASQDSRSLWNKLTPEQRRYASEFYSNGIFVFNGTECTKFDSNMPELEKFYGDEGFLADYKLMTSRFTKSPFVKINFSYPEKVNMYVFKKFADCAYFKKVVGEVLNGPPIQSYDFI